MQSTNITTTTRLGSNPASTQALRHLSIPVHTQASAANRASTNRYHSEAQAAEPELENDTAPDLRDGIDGGDPLTARGRVKKRSRENALDLDDADRYRYKAYHIRRAFDLFGHIPTIINEGIKRRAKEAAGEYSSNLQSNRDYETFGLIVNHLEGLDDDIVRLKRSPKEFRALIRKIREAADQARNNDTANLKKDISCMLTVDGRSVLTTIAKGKKASSKHDRGFDNDVMGKYLCPISLDWNDDITRREIRDGEHAIVACDWPRLLYADCECDLDDLELGLGRNMALVVKYLFTGRSAAFSETPGGKTTRSGNAALAGMKEVTPRVVAYAACMLRYAISNEESWSTIDKEFNMQDFYWHVVNIFDDSDDFGKELLSWWNMKVFGTKSDTRTQSEAPSVPETLSILRKQRQAKRAARVVLGDVTNIQDNGYFQNGPNIFDHHDHFAEHPTGIQTEQAPVTLLNGDRDPHWNPFQRSVSPPVQPRQTNDRAPQIGPIQPLHSTTRTRDQGPLSGLPIEPSHIASRPGTYRAGEHQACLPHLSPSTPNTNTRSPNRVATARARPYSRQSQHPSSYYIQGNSFNGHAGSPSIFASHTQAQAGNRDAAHVHQGSSIHSASPSGHNGSQVPAPPGQPEAVHVFHQPPTSNTPALDTLASVSQALGSNR